MISFSIVDAILKTLPVLSKWEVFWQAWEKIVYLEFASLIGWECGLVWWLITGVLSPWGVWMPDGGSSFYIRSIGSPLNIVYKIEAKYMV